MADGTIYLVKDGELARMRPAAPASENLMQALVARHPEVIADGDGGLLLVRREQPIADAADGAGRWSVDHLFVTREAVPVLVELKRAVDTRLRREVVGQMLDYAANAAAHWRSGTIAEAFADTCRVAGRDADEALRDFVGDADPAGFWQQVDANITAGRMKLVFVADVVPRELARIVEFLNEQMKADVRAVELRWYEGEGGATTLVPRVIGETQRAAAQKSAARGAPVPMTREEWIATCIAPAGEAAVAGAAAFIALVERLGGEAVLARTQGSVGARFKDGVGGWVQPFHLWRGGAYVSLSFAYLLERPGFADEAVRRGFMERVADAVGPLSTGNPNGYPGFDVARLAAVATAARVEAVFKDMLATAVAG